MCSANRAESRSRLVSASRGRKNWMSSFPTEHRAIPAILTVWQSKSSRRSNSGAYAPNHLCSTGSTAHELERKLEEINRGQTESTPPSRERTCPVDADLCCRHSCCRRGPLRPCSGFLAPYCSHSLSASFRLRYVPGFWDSYAAWVRWPLPKTRDGQPTKSSDGGSLCNSRIDGAKMNTTSETREE